MIQTHHPLWNIKYITCAVAHFVTRTLLPDCGYIFMHLCKIPNLQNARDAQNYSLSRFTNIKRISIETASMKAKPKQTEEYTKKLKSKIWLSCLSLPRKWRNDYPIDDRIHPNFDSSLSTDFYRWSTSENSSKISKNSKKFPRNGDRTHGKV